VEKQQIYATFTLRHVIEIYESKHGCTIEDQILHKFIMMMFTELGLERLHFERAEGGGDFSVVLETFALLVEKLCQHRKS
jgi:hypothetical protein